AGSQQLHQKTGGFQRVRQTGQAAWGILAQYQPFTPGSIALEGIVEQGIQSLVVDDSEDDAFLLLLELRKATPILHHARVDTAETLRAALKECSWDLILDRKCVV